MKIFMGIIGVILIIKGLLLLLLGGFCVYIFMPAYNDSQEGFHLFLFSLGMLLTGISLNTVGMALLSKAVRRRKRKGQNTPLNQDKA